MRRAFIAAGLLAAISVSVPLVAVAFRTPRAALGDVAR
jgi:hypothetical protein